MEFSQAIGISNREFKRLGWNRGRAKKFLLASYGVSSRQFLSNEQLEDLCKRLQELPF
jgi:hypothetical protein